MKVDFSTVIRGLKGEALKDGTQDATIGSISCNALMAPYPDEQNLAGTEKLRRFKLACKISDGGEQELDVDDVAYLLRLIDKGFSTIVVGRCHEILDPPPTAH